MKFVKDGFHWEATYNKQGGFTVSEFDDTTHLAPRKIATVAHYKGGNDAEAAVAVLLAAAPHLREAIVAIIQQARGDFNRPPSETLALIQDLAESALAKAC